MLHLAFYLSIIQPINIFDIHKNINDAYEEYIRSFVNISDERIRQEVKNSQLKDLIHPEPLVHFNTALSKSDLKQFS